MKITATKSKYIFCVLRPFPFGELAFMPGKYYLCFWHKEAEKSSFQVSPIKKQKTIHQLKWEISDWSFLENMLYAWYSGKHSEIEREF